MEGRRLVFFLRGGGEAWRGGRGENWFSGYEGDWLNGGGRGHYSYHELVVLQPTDTHLY